MSTSFGKLSLPGTLVRVTISVTRARTVRGDSGEADGRCEEMVEIVARRTETGKAESERREGGGQYGDGQGGDSGADNFGTRGDGPIGGCD